jgi:hypothetical protein
LCHRGYSVITQHVSQYNTITHILRHDAHFVTWVDRQVMLDSCVQWCAASVTMR